LLSITIADIEYVRSFLPFLMYVSTDTTRVKGK